MRSMRSMRMRALTSPSTTTRAFVLRQRLPLSFFLPTLLLIALLASGCANTNGSGSAHGTPTPIAPTGPAATIVFTGHTGPVIAVAWSPDSKLVASSGNDNTVQVIDAATGKLVWKYAAPNAGNGGNDYIFALAWSPDGKSIAEGSDSGVVRILDAATGQVKATLNGGQNGIEGIAWSPDGKRLAWGTGVNTAQVWDVASQRMLFEYTGQTDSIAQIAWSPDGTRIASASHDGSVKVWDATTGKTLVTYTGNGAPVWSVAWSPDGKRIASGTGAAGAYNPVLSGNSLRVWDAATGKTLVSYTGQGNTQSYALAWSPDGKHIISGGDTKVIYLWDATTGATQFVYRGHTDIVFGLAWSPDGTQFASASVDGSVHIWRYQG